jgi:serine/threonine protein kinase
VIDGYHELITNKVIHRDLKLANIFIHNGVYKIGDFGFATIVADNREKIKSALVGNTRILIINSYMIFLRNFNYIIEKKI